MITGVFMTRSGLCTVTIKLLCMYVVAVTNTTHHVLTRDEALFNLELHERHMALHERHMALHERSWALYEKSLAFQRRK